MTPAYESIEHRRTVFVRTFAVLTALLGLGPIVGDLVEGRPGDFVVSVGVAALFALGAVLAALGRSRTAGIWMMFGMTAAIVHGMHRFGLTAPVVGFAALLPVFGAMAGGPWLGALGLGVSAVAIAAVGIVSPAGSAGPPDWLVSSRMVGVLIGLVGMSGLMFALITDRISRSLESSRRTSTEADRAKSRLLANCSHDLRTPLTAVLGYTDLLREQAEDEERRDDVADLDRIAVASRLLLGRVGQVLDLARLEAGRVKVQPREVRLVDVLRSTGMPLRLRLPEDAVGKTDPALLAELLDALVDADGDGIGSPLVARESPPGWLRIEAPASQSGVATLAETIAARLAAQLGGRAGIEGGVRWVEIPVR